MANIIHIRHNVSWKKTNNFVINSVTDFWKYVKAEQRHYKLATQRDRITYCYKVQFYNSLTPLTNKYHCIYKSLICLCISCLVTEKGEFNRKVCIHCNATFHSGVSLSNHLRAYAKRKRTALLEGTSKYHQQQLKLETNKTSSPRAH